METYGWKGVSYEQKLLLQKMMQGLSTDSELSSAIEQLKSELPSGGDSSCCDSLGQELGSSKEQLVALGTRVTGVEGGLSELGTYVRSDEFKGLIIGTGLESTVSSELVSLKGDLDQLRQDLGSRSDSENCCNELRESIGNLQGSVDRLQDLGDRVTSIEGSLDGLDNNIYNVVRFSLGTMDLPDSFDGDYNRNVNGLLNDHHYKLTSLESQLQSLNESKQKVEELERSKQDLESRLQDSTQSVEQLTQQFQESTQKISQLEQDIQEIKQNVYGTSSVDPTED